MRRASPSIPRGNRGNKAGVVCVPPLRVCLRRCLFFAFQGWKDVPPGFRSACIETALLGPFRGLIGWRIEGRYRTQGGDKASPQRKASTRDAPAGLCARIRPYQVPDATSAVSSVRGRTHRRWTRKPPRTKPQQTRRPSPRCGAS